MPHVGQHLELRPELLQFGLQGLRQQRFVLGNHGRDAFFAHEADLSPGRGNRTCAKAPPDASSAGASVKDARAP